MPVDDIPDDDEIRETYNFAPGYHGLVYRANVPDFGSRADESHDQDGAGEGIPSIDALSKESDAVIKYKLQAMKWGNRSNDGLGV